MLNLLYLFSCHSFLVMRQVQVAKRVNILSSENANPFAFLYS